MSNPKTNVRRAAVSALKAWANGHTYMDTLIDRHSSRNHLSREDRSLLQNILNTVLRNRRLLDHWISKLRKGKLDHDTRDILRVGLAQILIIGIPDHAAVNETVNCGKAPVRGLINAVLRRAILKRKQLLSDAEELAPDVLYSHPGWLYKRWRQEFGKANAIKLMQLNNQSADTFARVNPLVAEGAEALANSDVAEAVEDVDGFYRITGAMPHEWLNNGYIYIQDLATRHSVELMDPQPDEIILDACAAPGGKAVLAAAAMQNSGELVCTDSNAKRLPRLQENLQRLKVANASVDVHDWSKPAPADWHGKFDAILLDVPCSNTGVIRRRIDVRWRLQLESIDEQVATQMSILENALPCLKPTGRLIYSTCSIESRENSELVAEFIAKHPKLKLVDERIITPFADDTDGAYAARLELK